MDNIFTELNTKYDAVSNHIKRIDVQLAQTAESVKRQQSMLPGKSAMNPRVEHCNATELRCDKAEGKEPEQLSAETTLDAEERTKHSASSKVTAPDELAETPPVRVYVPKVPYPIPPRHLMDPISAEKLAGFRKMVESQEDIKALFTEALTPSLKVLPKVDDPRKFVFPCFFVGVEFKEALCDSGSSVNLVSKAILDELGIVEVEPSLVTLAFANSSMTVPYGTIRNLPVQVGNCILHTEFQVVEMSKDHEMPLIFGRSFMATVGAVVDMPNKRVYFSNINKKVFYKAVPTRSQIRYVSCISVVSGEQLDIVPKREFGKKGEIKEVLDGDPHTDTKKLSGNAKVNEKVQKKRVKGDPMMTLIPRLCDEKSIEYEVKCKGTSKPFSKLNPPVEELVKLLLVGEKLLVLELSVGAVDHDVTFLVDAVSEHHLLELAGFFSGLGLDQLVDFVLPSPSFDLNESMISKHVDCNEGIFSWKWSWTASLLRMSIRNAATLTVHEQSRIISPLDRVGASKTCHPYAKIQNLQLPKIQSSLL
ncbi:hypothetical protein F2Q69_00019419 [Brassica cretica]|uniref:Aspartic peptidase DDI1-type domain-containing protein n=1 Tax=Brassica cretica TaxID=69181 RepID=A0A8S9QFX5_BRACR|nr:hypothetical protein F2Q69_00019419 [Brassica cretica]